MVLNLIPNRLSGILCGLSGCSVCFVTVSAEPEGLSRIWGICILDSGLYVVGTFYDHISSYFFEMLTQRYWNEQSLSFVFCKHTETVFFQWWYYGVNVHSMKL